MRLNQKGSFLFFLVSYTPLIVALLIKYSILTYSGKISSYIKSAEFIIILIIIFLLFVLILIFYKSINRIKEDEYPKSKCEIVELNNSEYMLFMISYLVPFVTIDFRIENLLPFLFLFVIMGLIYIKTPLLAINPMLNLMGYNLYKGIKSKNNVVIVSKNDLNIGSNELHLTPFYKNVYFEVGK